MKKLGESDDIAKAVGFLCSENANYITFLIKADHIINHFFWCIQHFIFSRIEYFQKKSPIIWGFNCLYGKFIILSFEEELKQTA